MVKSTNFVVTFFATCGSLLVHVRNRSAEGGAHFSNAPSIDIVISLKIPTWMKFLWRGERHFFESKSCNPRHVVPAETVNTEMPVSA